MNLLREQGFMVADVEHRLPFTQGRPFGFRQDLFGFGDLLAVKAEWCWFDHDHGEKVRKVGDDGFNLIVQVCRKQDMQDRIRKIKSLDEHRIWLSIPSNQIVVHGWHQPQKRKGSRWSCAIESVIL